MADMPGMPNASAPLAVPVMMPADVASAPDFSDEYTPPLDEPAEVCSTLRPLGGDVLIGGCFSGGDACASLRRLKSLDLAGSMHLGIGWHVVQPDVSLDLTPGDVIHVGVWRYNK
jgi:hypothetical protein